LSRFEDTGSWCYRSSVDVQQIPDFSEKSGI
jgi:hypothetical protein